MGKDRKRRIHIARGGLCAYCRQPCERFGPSTIYDHIVPLALGGPDVNSNVQLLHAEPCDRLKTARDKKHIAKAKRRAAKATATRIVSRLDIMGGDPCIEGTRIPAWMIRNFHTNGYSISEIIAEYPGLSEVQVQAAIDWKPVRMLRGRGFPKSSAKPASAKDSV